MASKPPEVKILGDATGASKAAREASTALGGLQSALDKAGGFADEAGDKVEQSDTKVDRFGKTADDTRGKVAEFGEDLKRRLGPAGEAAGGTIDKLTAKVGAMPTPMLAGAAATAALVAGMVALGKASLDKFTEATDQVRAAQSILGGTTEEVGKLTAAFNRAGVDADETRDAFSSFASLTREELEELGVRITETADGNVNMTETFYNAVDSINAEADASKKAVLQTKLFGETFHYLAPAINRGTSELRAFGDEAEDMGQLVDDSDIEAAEDLRMAFADVRRAADTLLLTLGSSLAPEVADVISDFARFAQALSNLESKTHIVKTAFGGLLAPLKGIASVAGAAADAMGVTSDASEELAASQEAAEAAALEHKEAQEQLIAAEKEAEEQQKALEDTLRDLEKAEQDAKRAHEDRVNAALGLIDGVHDVEQAERAVERALIDQTRASRDLDTAINEHGAESEEARVAALDLADAEDDVERALVDQARASADARIKTLEAGGANVDAAGKAAIQRDELAKLAGTLAPGSALRLHLEGLIGRLDAIPRHIPVRVTLDQAGISPEIIAGARAQIGAAIGGRAEGGPVRAGTPYLVGEEGPEIFTPRTPGRVISNDDAFAGNGTAIAGNGAGPFADRPIVVNVQLDKKTIAKAVVDYERSRR